MSGSDVSGAVTIPCGDVELVADAFGDPGDTPVVLLHGGGQTRHSWRTTGAELAADGWYVLAVDQRGHGDSSWSPDGVYDLDRYAEDVISIVRHLGRKPVLVGASLGGNASLAALGRSPELALGLVLVDVSPFLAQQGQEEIMAFMTGKPAGFASIDEVAAAIGDYLPHRDRPTSLDGLKKNLRERDGRLFWHWDPAFLTGTEAAAQRDALANPVVLGAAAMMVRIPSLLIRGGESTVLTEDDAVRFLRMVPHIEFREIGGAHHMVAGDENSAFGAAVIEFLDRRIRSRLEVLTRAGMQASLEGDAPSAL